MQKSKELLDWINRESAGANMIISEVAKEALLERVNFQPETLHKEFLKFKYLDCPVTLEVVEQLVPAVYSEKYFHLIRAALSGDMGQVRTSLKMIHQQDNAEYRILRYLFRFWEQSYNIFACLERGIIRDTIISEETDTPLFIVRRTLSVLSMMNLRAIRKMLSLLYDLDKQIRSFKTDPVVALEYYFLTLGETCSRLLSGKQ